MPRRARRAGALAAFAAAVAAAVAGAGVAGGTAVRAAAPAPAKGPTAEQRVAIVRDALAAGLACAIPGVPGGVRVESVRASGIMVTARVSGTSAATRGRIAFDLVFEVAAITSVRGTSATAQTVVDCAGLEQCVLPVARKGLAAKAPAGAAALARYGPVTVLGKVPGLVVRKDGTRWVIEGMRVAELGDMWVGDCGVGNGRIVEGSATVLGPRGKPVARVLSTITGIESTECPGAPLSVLGAIVTGDPRVLVDGRPVAVPGSRVVFSPNCGPGTGAVG